MSAKLSNPKWESYAQNLVKGLPQILAYTKAGFSQNAGGASNLKKRPEVAARIQQLEAERRERLPVLGQGKTLKEMGIDKPWIAKNYALIYELSMEAEQFGHAAASLKLLDKMRAEEQDHVPDADKEAPPQGRVDINAIGNVLDKFANILEISKRPNESGQIKDVTPANDLPRIKAVRASELE